jgi:hypothetical protein
MSVVRALHYYDEDGDGKFESVEWAQVYNFVPHTPDWVRQ